MEVSRMLTVVGGACSPCSAFVVAIPTPAAFLKGVAVCSCPTTSSYANPALLLQAQRPDHPLYSIERCHLGGSFPTTTAASARIQVLQQSVLPSSVGDGPPALPGQEQIQLDANTEDTDTTDGDGAERMFATARALHLRRHRSPASRGLALELFRETMRRRPAWKETDSRFAVESGIDEVFRSFSCPSDLLARPRKGHVTPETKAGDNGNVRCIRTTLARIGYTARTVQERFGVAGGHRLPGPYYLRKSLDHKNADVVASMGPPKDALDVAIRLFLLGLALPRAQAERSLGRDFLESADRLGMLGECPVDPLLLVSLVQLFPLDAEALLPPPPPPPPPLEGGQNQGQGLRASHGMSSASSGARGRRNSREVDGGCADRGRSGTCSIESLSLGSRCDSRSNMHSRHEAPPLTAGKLSSQQEPKEGGNAAVVPGRRPQDREDERGGVKSDVPGATTATFTATAAASHEAAGVVAASEMIFATDWPPPGSTAMTEEPVMYIGPDSIGLVQHAPRERPAEMVSPGVRRRRDAATGGAGDEKTVGASSGSDVCGHREEDVARVASTGGVGSSAGAGAGITPPEEAEAAGEAGEGPGSWGGRGKRTRTEGAAEEVLDLCCGSGVQGIAAAVLRRGAASVTCVDINPRAVRFSRFNALLNGLDERRFRAVVGDLYGALDSSAAAAAAAERSDCAAGGHSVDGGGGTPPPASSLSSCYYDLVLANPPFVPVPPRLGAARRRYDVFASGGPDGEEVIEGIFRGALERLRPEGGLLAAVTELANPRTFDTKLRRWVGIGAGAGAEEGAGAGEVTHGDNKKASGLVGGAGSEPAPAAAVKTETDQSVARNQEEEEEEDGEYLVPQRVAAEGNPGLRRGDAAARNGRTSGATRRGRGGGGVADGKGSQDLNRTLHHDNGNDAGNDGRRASSSATTAVWTAAVLHERQPWTARQYSARRAGSRREAEGWERHLGEVGIEEMSAGFVFVRRNEVDAAQACPPARVPAEEVSCSDALGGTPPDANAEPPPFATAAAEGGPSLGRGGDRPAGSSREGKEMESRVGTPPDGGGGGGPGGAAVSGVAAEIEVLGVEKLWAPHNRAAIQTTSAALRRMRNGGIE